MRVLEIDLDELDEDVVELLLVSGKLRTREQLMRKAISDALDPIIALGNEFEFEQRPDDELYISLEVPDRNSVVDLALAWRIALLDARACALVLDRDHSLAATIRVYKNVVDWLAFWAVRHPNDRWRAEFGANLAVRRLVVQQFQRRAAVRSKFAMLGELSAISSDGRM
jgi:hypothetical protein